MKRIEQANALALDLPGATGETFAPWALSFLVQKARLSISEHCPLSIGQSASMKICLLGFSVAGSCILQASHSPALSWFSALMLGITFYQLEQSCIGEALPACCVTVVVLGPLATSLFPGMSESQRWGSQLSSSEFIPGLPILSRCDFEHFYSSITDI